MHFYTRVSNPIWCAWGRSGLRLSSTRQDKNKKNITTTAIIIKTIKLLFDFYRPPWRANMHATTMTEMTTVMTTAVTAATAAADGCGGRLDDARGVYVDGDGGRKALPRGVRAVIHDII